MFRSDEEPTQLKQATRSSLLRRWVTGIWILQPK